MVGFWWGIGFCTDCSVYLGLGWFGWVVDCGLGSCGFWLCGFGLLCDMELFFLVV